MKATLFINSMIVLAIIVAMIFLQNPLALLALTFLQMPHVMPSFMTPGGDDEDEPNSIGFTADIA